MNYCTINTRGRRPLENPLWSQPPVSIREFRLVDLFCGTGGFSIGAHSAGFKVAAAFDNDPILTSSFSHNFPDTRLILRDVAELTGKEVAAAAGGRVDGIFGGPPCQGFSEIGRRQADDPRRRLLGHFFRIVAEVQPSFFIMENVKGLANAGARETLDEATALVSGDYSILGPHILDAANFGAATKRPRLFVVGIHRALDSHLDLQDLLVFRRAPATVRAAISDVADALPLGEDEGFDLWKIAKRGRPYAYARQLRGPDKVFTGQRSTAHTPEVVERFAHVAPGGIDAIGRHPRLDWDGQCPTLRAGTGSDRGSYQSVRPIHPTENRVITVREAARLQGFPDAHRFHPTIWHSFRMIGNSVSPIIAKALFEAVRSKLQLREPLRIAAE